MTFEPEPETDPVDIDTSTPSPTDDRAVTTSKVDVKVLDCPACGQAVYGQTLIEFRIDPFDRETDAADVPARGKTLGMALQHNCLPKPTPRSAKARGR